MAIVVLAAGMGTRMRSARPKVLHELAGKPMLSWMLEAAATLLPERMAVVVGPNMEEVAELSAPHQVIHQAERLGTGHAVRLAAEALTGWIAEHPDGQLMVLFGDSPLVRPRTLERLLAPATEGAALVAQAFRTAEPGAYGRMVTDGAGRLLRIVEAADADKETLAIDLVNGGLLAGQAGLLQRLLGRLANDNAKGEYYLTDVFALAAEAGEELAVVEAPEEELLGVNSRADLARAEAAMQRRLRARAFEEGASLAHPESVIFHHDTALAADVVVEPYVVFGPRVRVAQGARIRAFSHLEDAEIGPHASVGPHARLRGRAVLEEGAYVGNFVELKNARLKEGAKAAHLSYLGDAEIGAEANIGAGTITCNYDGFAKNSTVIGARAFIGSNSALVAPVTIGKGAIVGAGSVLTGQVGEEDLVVVRGERVDKAAGARRYRKKRRKD